MSNILYLASDCPLKPQPNPHEKMMSVKQALAAGVTGIPDFMLGSDFDQDKPDVLLISDRNIDFNIDTGIITDGDFDDDFNIWIPDGGEQLKSSKKYFAILQWGRLTEGRAGNIIKYISESLENTDEIELWHIWLGAEDQYHKLKSTTISIDHLSPQHIIQLENREMWGAMLTDELEIVYDHRYIITK